jgi:hypothetical protein
MTDWNSYLDEKEPSTQRKKRKGPGCKRNKIGKNRLGFCNFLKDDTCEYCKRPRKKVLRLDPKTNLVITEYLE